MAKNNPLVGKLDKDFNQYNQKVTRILDKVANWQYYVTIIIVVINIVAFFALQSIPDDFKIGKFDNYTVSFLASLTLLLISIPIANSIGKALLQKESTNMYSIDPTYDYSGQWEYLTTFKVKSPDDGSAAYQLVKDSMDDLPEKGTSLWVLNLFELHIDFAATKEDNKTKGKKDNMKNKESQNNSTKKTKVEWTSGPIEFNSHKVSWTFSGTIKWNNGSDVVNEFKGIESYQVVERDFFRRPTKLVGELLGTVKVEDKYYVVVADSSYIKVREKVKAFKKHEKAVIDSKPETSNITTSI